MNTLANIKQWKLIPPKERASWYIPEKITTSFPVAKSDEKLINVCDIAKQLHLPLIVHLENQSNTKVLLRTGAARKVIDAIRLTAKRSKNKITLKVYEAFRPLKTQRKEFNRIKKELATTEKLQGYALWQRITQFIADPDLCPPHSTGGAIDCTLAYTATEKELDMGTPINTISNKANTWHQNISDQAKKNRLLLFQIMTDADFVNLTTEWWHYSYGDQYWAIYKEMNKALYDSLPSS